MSFHISTWSIKSPVPTLVLFLILTVVGWMSFGQLGIDENPNIDIPIVSISVTQTGAGPTELETQVTRKVEDAVAGLGNIDDLNSTVTDGISTTTISFILGTDSDRATNDVRNAISQIRQDLPADINDPIVRRLDFAGGPILTYALRSDRRTVEELSDLVDRPIARGILAVPGVAQINRIGGVDREILIELDPVRIKALGITATQINDQIRSLNINLPGGRSQVGGSENTIRTLGSAQTVAALRENRILLPSGEAVPLESVANVIDGFAEPQQSARFWSVEGSANSPVQATNPGEVGTPVVAFSVLRSTGSTLVTVEEGVRESIQELQQTLPDDLEFELIFTRADQIRDSYQASIDALVIGCLLTVCVVGIFLRDWRATLITGVALPLSIIPTFMVMELLDYTLNGMTLLALSLAVGNLVDDAICMIENIDQHLKMGKRPYQAAMDAAQEIGLAVLATTATIVAVFLPVAFMGGIPGQFFQPFGVTVSVSTLFSTLVATTMTPMLSAYLLKNKHSSGRKRRSKNNPTGKGVSEEMPNSPRRKITPYRTALTWALKHRVITLLIAFAFFIGSLQLVPYIPTGLFNSGDTGLSTVSLELPPGSTLRETDRTAQRTIALVQQHPAVESVLATVGSGGASRELNAATLFINLLPRQDREVSQQMFEQQMREEFTKIPGARISFQSGGAGGSSRDLSIVLKSENPAALQEAADTLERQIRELPGLVEVSSSASVVKPEILIKPDPQRAADLGVSVQAIARTASLATLGDNEANLAKFDLSDRQIPIRVWLSESYRNDINAIGNLEIPSQSGRLVPLSAVANIVLGSGPAQIDRFDRARQVSIEANLQGVSLGDALAQVEALPGMQLPPGVEQQSSGDAKIMQEIFGRFLGALGLAVLAIFAILVLLYNNFLHPVTIMAALPLSIGGALLGLMVTQKELGLFALIGIVMLMGLVTKNAILLVDCTLANQQQGMRQVPAIIEAGVSRLRPIFMTALSTIAGMMPIALELGAGGEVRSPMAIAVIGGFSTSTLLTLIVVPVLFTYVDGFQSFLKNLINAKSRHRRKLKALQGKKGKIKVLGIK